jgi:hypothetical protein
MHVARMVAGIAAVPLKGGADCPHLRGARHSLVKAVGQPPSLQNMLAERCIQQITWHVLACIGNSCPSRL